MSLPVIKAVLKHQSPAGINILDAAPGTGCPVVEVLENGDAAVLVTEPTPFGLHDLKLAAALALKLKVPTGIVINRSCGEDALIEDFAGEVDIPIIGRIPFKRRYAEAYSEGKLLVREFPGLKIKMLQIFEKIKDLAGTRPAVLFDLPSPACKIPASDRADAPAGGSFKEVTILSGKGGTGKTTIAASLAKLAANQVIADTDVDAPDLHLLLKPAVLSSADFTGGKKALILTEKCTDCGECVNVCRFGAINSVELPDGKPELTVNNLACEGCGFCEAVCPASAIEMKTRVAGNASLSSTAYGPMTHALLDTGQENSGKLVSRVRQLARKKAEVENRGLIQVDGPPGTGCPVIASLGGTNLALVITEPTVSGLHDMKRVLLLAGHFNIPALLVINKSDLNRKLCDAIHQTARDLDTRVIAEIPFDRNVHDALMQGKILAEYKGPAAEAVKGLWAALQKELKSLRGPQLKIPA
jgi:MinD superfamily P-loop ATPase